MNAAHFERFLECEARGLRREAKEAVAAFIASFKDEREVRDWVWAALPRLETNRHARIRHELFEHLVFPVLKRGFEAGDIESTLWLGRLIQNLYQAPALYAGIGYVTDVQLLRRCHELDPSHDEARRLLLDAEIRWLDFCAHEWPGALLCGNAAADADDCAFLAAHVATLRGLDHEARFTGFLDEFERMLAEYTVRVGAREE